MRIGNRLVRFANLDALVIGFEYLFIAFAGARHAKSADLAQSDAMSVAAPMKGETRDCAVWIVLPRDGEQCVPQSQRVSDFISVQIERNPAADHLNMYGSAGFADFGWLQIPEFSDVARNSAQFFRDCRSAQGRVPAGHGRIAIAGCTGRAEFNLEEIDRSSRVDVERELFAAYDSQVADGSDSAGIQSEQIRMSENENSCVLFPHFTFMELTAPASLRAEPADTKVPFLRISGRDDSIQRMRIDSASLLLTGSPGRTVLSACGRKRPV